MFTVLTYVVNDVNIGSPDTCAAGVSHVMRMSRNFPKCSGNVPGSIINWHAQLAIVAKIASAMYNVFLLPL